MKNIKKQSRMMPRISVRVPDEVIKGAQQIARGTPGAKVSDVYRAILVQFFSVNRLQNGDGEKAS